MLSTSIGKKLGMALTGLLLYGFLIGHLAGNLQLFAADGGAAFNAYAEFLVSNPLLVPTELILLATLVIHVYFAVSLSYAARQARPDRYLCARAVGERSLASRTMIWSGLTILLFLVVHIRTFKFGHTDDGSLYDLVEGTFQQPAWASGYVAVMTVLGFHLWHALRSGLQTLGWYARTGARRASLLLSIILAGGFASIPIYFFLVQ